MPKRSYTPEKIARIEATTRFFKCTSRSLYICLAIGFGLLIAATAVPQKREYQKLLSELRKTERAETEIVTKKDYKEIQLHALREDNAFLEVQARDRLNYYRRGERILRFDPNN